MGGHHDWSASPLRGQGTPRLVSQSPRLLWSDAHGSSGSEYSHHACSRVTCKHGASVCFFPVVGSCLFMFSVCLQGPLHSDCKESGVIRPCWGLASSVLARPVGSLARPSPLVFQLLHACFVDFPSSLGGACSSSLEMGCERRTLEPRCENTPPALTLDGQQCGEMRLTRGGQPLSPRELLRLPPSSLPSGPRPALLLFCVTSEFGLS